MRCVHMDFHTTSPAIDGIGVKFDKEKFTKTIREANIDLVTVFGKCHHGYTYYPSKVGEMHPGLKNKKKKSIFTEALKHADMRCDLLLDALAVIATCYYERIEAKELAKELKTFEGAKRRFQETVVGDNIIIDDYAHHPNEVKATLKAIKQKYPDKKIISVFQPHTFTRTAEFADDLVNVMKTVDKAYVMDIHPSRECQEDYPEVTSDIIIKQLPNGEHIGIEDASKFEDIENTVVIFMSPNDISKLENEVIELLENRPKEI